MTSKAMNRAQIEVLSGLKELQEGWKTDWLDRSIPKGWNFLDENFPTRPKKKKMTITLDADMVTWFRGLGRGYQARMNMILRVYWKGLMSGAVKSHWEEGRVGAQYVAFQEHEAAKVLAGLEQFQQAGVMDAKEADDIRNVTQQYLAMVRRAAEM